IVYTYLDAKRRISDPFLIGCATIASFFPYIGTAVYAIVRPPEFLEDAHERELEIKAAELRVRQLTEQSCPNCDYPVEKNYLRCPQCQRRLKDPCPSCGKPVDPRWALCPYCEVALPERARRPKQRAEGRSKAPPREERSAPRPERAASREEKPAPKRQAPPRKKANASSKEPARSASAEAPKSKRTERNPDREPDADPRKA
ncbi:MAG TPA: zinc ribbon domain-containing protein, partial [Solirubrobacterales bacterium]|nr:zinc ribbon domain-containing protein [Solirubrobacterales bacterium]